MKKELPEFDVLLDMAAKRPEQLEQLRADLIEDIISSAPERLQRRLRGLQFKVDATRQMSRNPMASCIKVSQMMHESLHDLREALGTFQQAYTASDASGVVTASVEPAAVEVPEANVVSLFTYRARRSQHAREARS